jgi:hypothetical protein
MAENKKQAITEYVEGRMTNGALFEKDQFVDARGKAADPSYKIELVSTEANIVALEEAVVKAAVAEWGAEAADQYYDTDEIRSPIQDAAAYAAKRREKGKVADAYEGDGLFIVRASTIFNKNGENAPGGVYVCNEESAEVGFAERDQVYNGCYVMANVTASPYVIDGRRGVTLYLNGVQKTADGERLRGKDPSSLFKPMMDKGSEEKGRRRRGA